MSRSVLVTNRTGEQMYFGVYKVEPAGKSLVRCSYGIQSRNKVNPTLPFVQGIPDGVTAPVYYVPLTFVETFRSTQLWLFWGTMTQMFEDFPALPRELPFDLGTRQKMRILPFQAVVATAKDMLPSATGALQSVNRCGGASPAAPKPTRSIRVQYRERRSHAHDK